MYHVGGFLYSGGDMCHRKRCKVFGLSDVAQHVVYHGFLHASVVNCLLLLLCLYIVRFCATHLIESFEPCNYPLLSPGQGKVDAT